MKNKVFNILGIASILMLSIYCLTFFNRYKPKNNVTEITYWQYWSGFEADAIQDLVDKFNREHDDIKVKMLTISEPWKKTLLSIIGGSPPDVLNTTSEWLPDLARRNALLPIDNYIGKSTIYKSDFIPVYWEMLEYDGHLWGLPLAASSTALFWNKDLFKDAGLNPDIPPKTPKEWEYYAEKLTVKDSNGNIQKSGFFPSWPSWASSFYPLQFMGSWGDPKGSYITANHPGNIKAWEWAQGFAKRLGPENIQSFQEAFGNYQGPNNPFYSGKIAFEISGVWEGNFISKFAPKLNWGATVPQDTDGNLVTNVICTSIVIPRGAKHPEEAFYFISWLMKQENIEELSLKLKIFSPLLASDNASFISKHSNPYIKVFIDAAKAKNASYFPSTIAFNLYKREIRKAFDEVMRLEKSPELALNIVQTTVINELKRQEKYQRE